jgi:hypothetical protein
MTKTLELDRVKAAAEALSKLNRTEMEFLKTYLAMTRGAKGAKVLAGIDPEPEKPERRGPDPRGRYKCSLCEKVLPTKRGRGIHMKMHDKQTAPTPAPVKP